MAESKANELGFRTNRKADLMVNEDNIKSSFGSYKQHCAFTFKISRWLIF